MKKRYLFLSVLVVISTIYTCDKDKNSEYNKCAASNLHNCDTSGLVNNEDCCWTTGPIQVYKTRYDYSNKVSVQLSEDKTKIVAYPGITDVEYQRPIQLVNGYLLKKMVGNAFLSITIDEYKNLPAQPSDEELMKLIINENPFCEFYECCKLCLNSVIDINKLILKNKLCNCDSIGWWIFN
jgi:hypothetical protein